MPYKFEKIPLLVNTMNDKRRKLTQEQKDEIAALKGTISQRECAKLYNVSRRLITFIWNPEKHTENLQRRKERGGSKIYYDKEKHKNYMMTHRKHKQKIFIESKI